MGSFYHPQFQHLNHYSPFPPNHPTPTIIPKLEPLDEPLYPPPPPPPPPPHHPTSPPTHPSAGADVYAEILRQNGDVSNSLAIVPFQNHETQISNVVLAPRGTRKFPARSSELVRVTDVRPEDQAYLRDVVRKTRILYDSLRVFLLYQYDRNGAVPAPNRRTRADLKAGSLMADHGLWLNRDKRVVGDLPGLWIGDVFFYRTEMCVVGLHGQMQAGIDSVTAGRSSSGEPIATSVIVSGGYEDDEDSGEVIYYTGHGGQDGAHRQVAHQKLERGNLGMERSMVYGVEIRVIRGFNYEGSPSGRVYVYDGLYRVVETLFDVGKSGFGVYKFKLVRIENQGEMGSAVMKFAQGLKNRPLDIRPRGYVSLDWSNGKENLPVYFFNDVDSDHDPMYYQYLKSTVFPPFVYNGGSGAGCKCVGTCRENNCFCAAKNGDEFAYDSKGILIRGKPLIFECGPHCKCPPSCRNRVSQNGVRHRFEVFRSRETNWGVRSLALIQAGSFICEYAGVVLTRDQVQIFTMNGDNLIYPSRFADRWTEWGNLSSIFADDVRLSSPAAPPLDFAMDVSAMRNVACYMSHSSCPNAMVQHVLYDHNNLSFPHIMVFALENIPPMREISLDYGVADEWSGKLAICN